MCFRVVMSMFLTILFFCNYTATTEIYTYLHTLSLHDALPIFEVDGAVGLHELDSGAAPDRLDHLGPEIVGAAQGVPVPVRGCRDRLGRRDEFVVGGRGCNLRLVEPVRPVIEEIGQDRKSTRLNSSH